MMYDFGVKYGTLLAGFFGGVVYVALTEGLNKYQVFSSLLIGVLTASYLTPILTAYASKVLDLPISTETENGIAFLIGLCAISVIPAIIRKVRNRVDVER